jgi:exopolysaccharide production protein ExoQ
MDVYNSKLRLVGGRSSESVSVHFSHLLRRREVPADAPVSWQVLSWLLFWPILTLIARQAVYFAGPARIAEAYQNGAAVAGARGSHYYLYVNALFLLGFVLAEHRQVWSKLKRNPLILAMLILAVCSALWSATPIVTLQMCIQVGLCTLFACYLSARYTTERLMQLVVFMGVAAALLSILFVLALPGYGLFQGYAGGAWQGICNHKNTLGISMAFLLSPVFFTDSYSRDRKLIYAALLLFLIYKSQSRGAWLDTAGLLLFVACLSLIRRVRTRELTLMLLVMTSVGLGTIALGVHFWPLLAAQMGKSASMSGRTGIYVEVWRSITKRPMLGYGFGSFWSPESAESHRIGLAIGWPNIGYAENGFLEVALQIGLVGVGLVIAMIAKAVFQGIRLLRSPHYSNSVGWFLTILFLAALTNIDAGWLMTSDTLDWVLILVSCIGMNDEMRRSCSLQLNKHVTSWPIMTAAYRR